MSFGELRTWVWISSFYDWFCDRKPWLTVTFLCFNFFHRMQWTVPTLYFVGWIQCDNIWVFSIVHIKCSASGGVLVIFIIVIIIGSVYVKRRSLAAIVYSDKSLRMAWAHALLCILYAIQSLWEVQVISTLNDLSCAWWLVSTESQLEPVPSTGNVMYVQQQKQGVDRKKQKVA